MLQQEALSPNVVAPPERVLSELVSERTGGVEALSEPSFDRSPHSAEQLLQQILHEGEAEAGPPQLSPRLRRSELDLLLRRADEVLGSPSNSITGSLSGSEALSRLDDGGDLRGLPEREDAGVASSVETSLDTNVAAASSTAADVGVTRGIAAAAAKLEHIRRSGNRVMATPLRSRAPPSVGRRQRLGLLKLEPLQQANLKLQSDQLVRSFGRPRAIALHPSYVAVRAGRASYLPLVALALAALPSGVADSNH